MKNLKFKINLLFFLVLLFSFTFQKRATALNEQDDWNNKNHLPPLSTSNSGILEEWYRTWGGQHTEYAYAMALDSSGNIYIAGETSSYGAGNYDMVIVKYNSLGNFQWYRTWGGSGYDRANGIALDSSRNIYIVGQTKSFSWSYDMSLVKFDSSGNYQWNRTWGGSGEDSANAIALDSSGNIYVTGYDAMSYVAKEICLLKYDSLGNLQWDRTWGGGSFYDDEGSAIALDSSGNIYITGGMDDIKTGSYDVCLLKYDISGNYQWNRTWGGSDWDWGESIALDSSENIFIAGFSYSYGMDESGICLLKYDNLGNLQWDRIRDGSVGYKGKAIALDLSGNIYISGYTIMSSLIEDILLVKYDSSGNFKWDGIWGGNGGELGRAIVLDSSENIYITGYGYTEPYNLDFILLKFSSSSLIPVPFTLYSDATNPDIDGTFSLSWGSSFNTDKYSVYVHNNYISNINGSVSLVANELTERTYPISGLNSGTYYYVVVAYNKFGQRLSNCKKVAVQIPSEEDDGNDPRIPYGSFYLLFIIVGIIFLVFKKKTGRNSRFVFRQESQQIF